MIKYKIEDISCFSDSDLTESYNMMCGTRQEQIKRYKNESAKRATLAGEFLVRTLLAELTEKNKDFFVIIPDSAGKPKVQNLSGVFFNISHSENKIAVVVSDVKVGIDIEVIRPVQMNLIKRTCNDSELMYTLGNRTEATADIIDKDVCRRFFEVWTLKEAHLKCIGTGISGLKHMKNLSSGLKATKIVEEDFVVHIVQL